jgi:hypothetical protein
VADSNLGDAPIFRRVTAMAAADRERIALWSSAVRGAAQMVRWQSAELRQRAALARSKAKALRAARDSKSKDPAAD